MRVSISMTLLLAAGLASGGCSPARPETAETASSGHHQCPPWERFEVVLEEGAREMLRNTPEDVSLVDIRERGGFVEDPEWPSLHLPIDEIGARASFELDRTRRIVIDCFESPANFCAHAAAELEGQGFSRVQLLDRKPLEASTCSVD